MGHQIGTDHADLTELATLGVPEPNSYFYEAADQLDAGDGSTHLVGSGLVVWQFSLLEDNTTYETLKNYVTGSRVNIVTRLPDGTFAEYTGMAVFPPPQEQEIENNWNVNLRMEFRRILPVV